VVQGNNIPYGWLNIQGIQSILICILVWSDQKVKVMDSMSNQKPVESHIWVKNQKQAHEETCDQEPKTAGD
jgi:hypothetical protein